MDGFAALADPIRRDLMRQLATGPARVVDLTAAYDVSRPAVSRHLRLLTEAGVASAEDRGRERHYRLEPAGLDPVRRLLAELTDLAMNTELVELDEPHPSPAATPRIAEAALDRLDTEVHRTRRDRRAGRPGRTAAPTDRSRKGAG